MKCTHKINERNITNDGGKKSETHKVSKCIRKMEAEDVDCGCFAAKTLSGMANLTEFEWDSTSQLYGQPLKLYRTFCVGNHTK